MLRLILQRLGQMLLLMVFASFLIFAIFDTPAFKKKLAVAELGGFGVATLSDEAYANWLASKGLDGPFFERYGRWIGDVLRGDLGQSFEKSRPVGPMLAERLWNTAILAFWVFALMIPLGLLVGVLAGMKEGSAQDRILSFVAVFTTSIPEIATAILLTVVLALGLGWLPAKAAMIQGFDPWQLALPVLTLVLYAFGYLARMTRASMAEVMMQPYIRTAVLKGLPRHRVIMRHALRNALIAPFTIIVLQLNWLLSGVVVVEVFFEYNGFGRMLLEAALFGDVYVVQAATLVAVAVAVASQLVSDIGYTFLNPRIRFG